MLMLNAPHTYVHVAVGGGGRASTSYLRALGHGLAPVADALNHGKLLPTLRRREPAKLPQAANVLADGAAALRALQRCTAQPKRYRSTQHCKAVLVALEEHLRRAGIAASAGSGVCSGSTTTHAHA